MRVGPTKLLLSCRVILLLVWLLSCGAHADEIHVSINIDEEKQLIEGFGASDAWSIDPAISQWMTRDQEPHIEKLADLLFSTDSGIGLSIWRFNIGAGSSEQGETSRIPDRFRRAELLQAQPGSPILNNRQEGQIRMLQAATARDVEKIVAFANSPPVWATKNGLAHPGNRQTLEEIGSTNLHPKQEANYARFLIDVITHLHNQDIPITDLSPANEPTWHWGDETQEGNRYNNEDLLRLYRQVNAELIQSELTESVSLDVGEVVEYRAAMSDQDLIKLEGSSYSAGMNQEGFGNYRNYIDLLLGQPDMRTIASNKLSLHGYWSDAREERVITLRDALRKNVNRVSPDARLWMSEYAILGPADEARPFDGHGFDPSDMSYALHVASIMHHDLTRLNVSAWFWWLALTPYDYKDGLIKIDPDLNPESMQISKLFWMMGHYSRFVRPGAYRLCNTLHDDLLLSSYRNSDTSVVLVMVNRTVERKFVNITGLNQARWQVYTTDSLTNHAQTQIRDDRIIVPANSIVTAVSDTP